jgi:hypothetical protein
MNNSISNTNLTILLFEATSISASALDKEFKHSAKLWYKKWWNEGIRLWKELRLEIKSHEFAKEGEEYYDESSAFLYDVAKIVMNIDIDKRDEIIKILKEYGNNSNNT